MTMQDDALRPEDFAEAAAAAIADATRRDLRGAARVLAEAGLFGICAAEDDGGLGLGLEFARPIAELAGRLGLNFPLVEQMLLARAFTGTDLAARLIDGEMIATIAWQGGLDAGQAAHAAYGQHCDAVLVAAQDAAALVARASVSVTEDPALDPERPQIWLGLAGAEVIAPLTADAWQAITRDARLLLGSLVTGAAENALEVTAAYLSTRVQFGRPITAKQAARHTLARMKLLVETSKAALDRCLVTDEFGAPRDAQAAFAGAVGTAIHVLERAIHLHGGMGFTWDVPLHYALRDSRKIEAAFDLGTCWQALGQSFIDAA
jgi:alkylation response protein AidB-like acyl-CoA dehydrogenase